MPRTPSTSIRMDADAARILVVEDEVPLADTIKYNLEREGYAVTLASDGLQALERFRAEGPKLVILDLMLPEMSGLDVCRLIRKESNVPIVMVTAKDSEADKVAGLELGADDYVTKPFSVEELVSRVRAVLRREERVRRHGPLVRRIENLEIDFEAGEVSRGGSPVTLTRSEFRVLALLAERP